mmetsp:Transcript_34284/g.72191  ORF Transcript_34284/g.72191 Transcript_34284/m.72191 type:complete len:178 (+) Transcript_34284:272-805(+)
MYTPTVPPAPPNERASRAARVLPKPFTSFDKTDRKHKFDSMYLRRATPNVQYPRAESLCAEHALGGLGEESAARSSDELPASMHDCARSRKLVANFGAERRHSDDLLANRPLSGKRQLATFPKTDKLTKASRGARKTKSHRRRAMRRRAASNGRREMQMRWLVQGSLNGAERCETSI